MTKRIRNQETRKQERRGGRERSEGKRGKRRERGGERRERGGERRRGKRREIKVSPSASFASGESNEKESTAVCVP